MEDISRYGLLSSTIGNYGLRKRGSLIPPTPPEVRTYATWNPADKGTDITLSSGNLLATQPNTNWEFVRSTIGKSSGKWYWESTVQSSTYFQVGVQDTNGDLNTGIAGVIPVGCSYNQADGGKVINGVGGTYGAPYTTGDIIGVALDMLAGTVEFYKNGVAQGAIFGLSGTQYAANSIYQGSSLINFGATPFAYTVPTGYNAGLYDVPVPVPPGAVFATWNPSDKSAGVILSSGDLTVSKSSGASYDGVRATIGKSSGKWYWEIVIGNIDNDAYIGIADSSFVLTGNVASGNTYVYRATGAFGLGLWTGPAFGSSFGTGDVIGFALDNTALTFSFYKNGIIQGTSNLAVGTWFPLNTVYSPLTVGTTNFGATPFAYSVPSGYNQGLYDTVDLTAGLVAHYPLATNSLDTSGNGYDGADTDIIYSSGSAVFNGSTSNISIGNVLDETGANPFSISFQGKFNDTITTFIVAKSFASGSFGGYGIQFNYGQIEFYMVANDGSFGRIEKVFGALSTGVNYNIVCTYDGSKTAAGVNMYIGGVLITGGVVFDSFGGKNSSTTAGFYIGSRDGGNLPINGSINKVRKYNRVLNASEISALYNEVDLASGLVAHYPLATNSLDISGNGNNGTDTAITYSSGSAVFNGTSSNITIPSNTDFDFGAEYFISTWINMPALPTSGNLFTLFYRLLSPGFGPQFELVLFNDGGTQKIFVSQATTFNPINYSLPTNQFVNLCIGYTAGVITFYLNSVAIGSVAQAVQCGAAINSMVIGLNADILSRYFNGSMKLSRIYNRVLNAGEIAALYAEG